MERWALFLEAEISLLRRLLQRTKGAHRSQSYYHSFKWLLRCLEAFSATVAPERGARASGTVEPGAPEPAARPSRENVGGRFSGVGLAGGGEDLGEDVDWGVDDGSATGPAIPAAAAAAKRAARVAAVSVAKQVSRGHFAMVRFAFLAVAARALKLVRLLEAA